MCHLRSLGFRRLVLALLTVGILSGPWAAASRAQPSGELTLLYALPEPESTMMRESVLPAWQERYSDVEIQVIEAPIDSLMSRYAQELEAGTSPLVLIAPAHWGGSLVGLGCCLPRPTGPRGEVWELSVEAMTVDDELLGHPLGASTV